MNSRGSLAEFVSERDVLGDLGWIPALHTPPDWPTKLSADAAVWIRSRERVELPASIAPELDTLGWCDAEGPTDAGRWASAALNPELAASLDIVIVSVGGGSTITRNLVAGFDHEVALVLAAEGQPPWSLAYVSLESLAERVIRWMDIVPMWTPALDPIPLAPPVLTSNPGFLPEIHRVDEVLAAVLSAPRQLIAIRAGGILVAELAMVHGWGCFEVHRAADGVVLRSTTSGEVTMFVISTILAQLPVSLS